jgi:hypothetical protein
MYSLLILIREIKKTFIKHRGSYIMDIILELTNSDDKSICSI